jgi:hypothetical protein
MNRAFGFCLFGAATLVLCRCSSQSASSGPSRARPPDGTADYSLTQRSASQPNRGSCNQTNGCADPQTTDAMTGIGRCDVELCEGELSATALTDLRASAAQARDCYERELKERNRLEGKMLVRLRLAAGRDPCEIHVQEAEFAASETFVNCVLLRLRETKARPTAGCIDLVLPLVFVRQEVDLTPDGGVPTPPPKQ